MTNALTLNSINRLCGTPLKEVEQQGKFSIASLKSSPLAKVDAGFETTLRQIKTVEMPLTCIETGLEWGALVSSVEHYSSAALNHLTMWAQPAQIVTLIWDVKRVAQMTFASLVEGKEMTAKPAEITQLGFSIVTRFCKTLSWLQNLGVITPAVAIAWRISFVGTFCALMGSSVQLGDNVLHYTSAAALAKAFLNFTVAMIAVYLLFQVSVHLQVLSLILTTGTLFLSVATGTH
jgi:hypothetical protein